MIAFMARKPGTEQHDLLVLRSLRRAQSVSFLVFEVEGEKALANGETISGNDQNQHAGRLEPAIAVLEKYLFQPAVLGLAALEVVGWIQIEQRQGLHWAVHIQGIAMNDVVADLAGLFDAVSVQFDTVSDRQRIFADHRKRAAVADAGVQSCVCRK